MASKVMIPMAEFDELVEPDELRYELDEGELIVMTRPQTFHNHIAGNFFMSLKLYLRNRPIGTVFNSDQLYQLGPSTKRAPDVSVVLKPRVLGRNEELNGAPDLAIEVISPSESHPAIHRKLTQYFRAGCQMALVVYPETNEIEIWRPPGAPGEVLGLADTLSLPTLLPEWSLPVSEAFRED